MAPPGRCASSSTATATAPARGYDLEIEISKLVHRKLCVHYDRNWTVSVQPSAVQLLPLPLNGSAPHGDEPTTPSNGSRPYRSSLNGLGRYLRNSLEIFIDT